MRNWNDRDAEFTRLCVRAMIEKWLLLLLRNAAIRTQNYLGTNENIVFIGSRAARKWNIFDGRRYVDDEPTLISNHNREFFIVIELHANRIGPSEQTQKSLWGNSIRVYIFNEMKLI